VLFGLKTKAEVSEVFFNSLIYLGDEPIINIEHLIAGYLRLICQDIKMQYDIEEE
jgi:hypothetical protein